SHSIGLFIAAYIYIYIDIYPPCAALQLFSPTQPNKNNTMPTGTASTSYSSSPAHSAPSPTAVLVTRTLPALAVAAVFVGWTLYLLSLLAAAFRHSSIPDGFADIRRDPWAISALSDYVASLPLSAGFIGASVHHHLSESPYPSPFSAWATLAGVLAALATSSLGSGIVLVYAATLVVAHLFFPARITTSATAAATTTHQPPPLRASWFPLRAHTPTSAHGTWSSLGLAALRIVTFLDLAQFTYFTLAAVAAEPAADGWRYITGSPWALASFVDSFGGVLLAMAYVVVRETSGGNGGGNGAWGVAAAAGWLVALALAGNGAGCVYVLLATWRAGSVGEALLKPESIGSLFRAPRNAVRLP
ncbi:hypothetical protein DFJ73DRAFT_939154, partial [Zopfochytrium polystomum]